VSGDASQEVFACALRALGADSGSIHSQPDFTSESDRTAPKCSARFRGLQIFPLDRRTKHDILISFALAHAPFFVSLKFLTHPATLSRCRKKFAFRPSG
jgi:hypothetical protein